MVQSSVDFPFRLVVVDDVVGHLVPLSSIEAQSEILYRCLEFLGCGLRKRFHSGHEYIVEMSILMEESGPELGCVFFKLLI